MIDDGIASRNGFCYGSIYKSVPRYRVDRRETQRLGASLHGTALPCSLLAVRILCSSDGSPNGRYLNNRDSVGTKYESVQALTNEVIFGGFAVSNKTAKQVNHAHWDARLCVPGTGLTDSHSWPRKIFSETLVMFYQTPELELRHRLAATCAGAHGTYASV